MQGVSMSIITAMPHVTKVTEKSRPLYLIAAHAHGTNIIWEWVGNEEDYWKVLELFL